MIARAAVVSAAVILLATAGGAVALSYRNDLGAARQRTAAAHVLATRCGPVQYAEVGSGPALLVVHGAGGGFDQALEVAGGFARHGWRVIAVSRFGYLGTPLPQDASPEAQADAHACALDALDIPRTAVLGASAGAPSAMQLALRHRDRVSALVLLVPAAYWPHPASEQSLLSPAATNAVFNSALTSDFGYWAASRVAPGLLIRALLATLPEVVAAAPVPERERVARMIDHILPVSARRAGLLNDAHVVATLPRYDLESIQAPTLVVSASDDLFGTLEPARYTAAHIPGARFVGFERGGHLLVGHQDEVDALVAGFLARTQAAADTPARAR